MEQDKFRTPNKIFQNSSTLRLIEEHNSLMRKTPGCLTPNSVKHGRFHSLPVINTPPMSRLSRVVNPFEAALTERLHLPLICSPSLFHRPSTPQFSSTQFEWTIEDVSTLGPANVEPHETQFESSPDPEIEAKAQAAINSYFREQHIVPSPADCPLRNKIIIPDDLMHSNSISLISSSLATANRKCVQKRNGFCQTILSFPPILPKDIEEILKPYFSYTADQQQAVLPDNLSMSNNCDIISYDQEARDASLRRKLFENSLNTTTEEDHPNSPVLVHDLSPGPMTPELNLKIKLTRNFDSPQERSSLSSSLSITPIKKESFGSLSPISKLTTPQSPTMATDKKMKSMTPGNSSSIFISTPERLKSIYANMSIDGSFTTTKYDDTPQNMITEEKENISVWNEESYDDDMQISQLSSSSGNTNLQTTPIRRNNRSASRKNLSRSFSQILDTFDDQPTDLSVYKSKSMPSQSSCNFLRTDSGFNETSCDYLSDYSRKYFGMENKKIVNNYCSQQDVSMKLDKNGQLISSTPSKYLQTNL